MTESNRIARLIYKAWIAPCVDEDFADFEDALQLYAAAQERDLQAARMEEWKKNIESGVIPTDYPGSIRLQAPQPDPPPAPDPAPDTHTHTHTAGTNDGGVGSPADFAGYGAGEKRDIHALLTAFIQAHGIGARRKIAEHSGGVLTREDVQAMVDCRRVTLSKWRAARDAMDLIEEEEKDNATKTV